MVKRTRQGSGRQKLDPGLMDQLFGVGPTKPIGYLPIRTITRCGWSAEDAAEHAKSGGLCTRTLTERECKIVSGALYVWDGAAVQRLLDLNRNIVEASGWPGDADAFVAAVWSRTAERGPLYELIGVMFHDSRMNDPQWVVLG